MRIRVLFDACVLVPYQLSDLVLRLAASGLYEPLWSEEILTEVQRTLVTKLGISLDKAQRRLGQVRAAFPNATVDGYADLAAAMRVHAKDRHVAAAAVRGNAALIVTANLADFPAEALEPYDIEVVHPDDFLQHQLDLDWDTTLSCLRQQRAVYKRPQFTVNEFYLALGRTVPVFAQQALTAEAASVVPVIDAERFELVANILRPGLTELFRASDIATSDKSALIQAAAVVEWLIAQCEHAGVIYRALAEEMTAQLSRQPIPDQPEAAAAKLEMALEKRPPMAAILIEWEDLPALRSALEEAEQILSWSRSEGGKEAAARIRELRQWA